MDSFSRQIPIRFGSTDPVFGLLQLSICVGELGVEVRLIPAFSPTLRNVSADRAR